MVAVGEITVVTNPREALRKDVMEKTSNEGDRLYRSLLLAVTIGSVPEREGDSAVDQIDDPVLLIGWGWSKC